LGFHAKAPETPTKFYCKIRLRHEPALALIKRSTKSGDNVYITFEEPQSAITPGQTAAFTMVIWGI
jgi:tRNA U34 2-thiouridine synthase MnmA/TrmU